MGKTLELSVDFDLKSGLADAGVSANGVILERAAIQTMRVASQLGQFGMG